MSASDLLQRGHWRALHEVAGQYLRGLPFPDTYENRQQVISLIEALPGASWTRETVRRQLDRHLKR